MTTNVSTEHYNEHVAAYLINNIYQQFKGATMTTENGTPILKSTSPSCTTYTLVPTASLPTAKGQVCHVLLALSNLTTGTLEDMVVETLRVAPGYVTKTPIEASVKYHLHQLALKGVVKESR